MRSQLFLRSIVLCVGLAACIAARWLCSVSLGEQPAADPARPGVEHYYVNNDRCAKCHSTIGDPDKKPDDKDGGKARINFMFCTEYSIWHDHDKHQKAYEALSNPTSMRIAGAMGISCSDGKCLDSRCLSCHAMNVKDRDCQSTSAADFQKSGVGCQACHGPASAWFRVHDDPDGWRRIKTPAEKTAEGMLDLRNPAVRAEKCLSCHLGNPDEGKVVTHEMYAAGHPPVPGFEVESFLNAMPAHWHPLADQPAKLQEQYGYRADESMRKTRCMVIGGLVALRQYARLIAFYAKQRLDAEKSTAGRAADAATIELAAYDCQACHHELSPKSWRQAADFRRHPGRPAPRAWPMALAKPAILGSIALAATGENKKPIVDALQALDDALGAQPFGDPVKVLAAAKQIDTLLGPAIDQCNNEAHFDDKTGIALARAICESGSKVVDFESARQLGLAFKVIVGENKKLAQEKRLQWDREMIGACKDLSDGLALDMPDPDDASSSKAYLPDALMKASTNYQPETLAKAWAVLATKLAGVPVQPAHN